MPQAPEGPRNKKKVVAKKKNVVGKKLGPFPVPKEGVQKVPRKLGPYPVPKKAVRRRLVKSGGGSKGVPGKKLGPYPVPRAGLKKVSPRHASDPVPTPRLKRMGVSDEGVRLSPLGKKGVAPALTVLDTVARPAYAFLNAQRQHVKDIKAGRPPSAKRTLHAAGRGLSGEEKTTGGDLLKEAGVRNKVVRAVGGEIINLGVAAGYPGFRGGSLARSGAQIAGERAAKKTAKRMMRKGVSPERARRAGEAAGRREAEKKAKRRGVWVGFGYGKRGQIRANVRTDRTILRRGALRGDKAQAPSHAADATTHPVRETVSHVRPSMRRNGSTSLDDHVKVRAIKREQRATVQTGRRKAQARYDAVSRAVPAAAREDVTHAVESRSTRGVPGELRETTNLLIADSKHNLRLRKRVGLGGDVTSHVKLPKTPPDLNASRAALAAARKAERAARTAERRAKRKVGTAKVREAEARGVAAHKVRTLDRRTLAAYLAEFEGQHPLSQALRELRKATKARDKSRARFGNRARYSGQRLYDDVGGIGPAKSAAEARVVRARQVVDRERERLQRAADAEFGKKQRGEDHDKMLAALGREDERTVLERYAKRSADVAGRESEAKGATARVGVTSEARRKAEKKHRVVRAEARDYHRRVRLRGGEKNNPPKGYMMHVSEEDIASRSLSDPLHPPVPVGKGHRKVKKSIRAFNAEVKDEADKFVTDTPTIIANATVRDARAIASRQAAVEGRGLGVPLPLRKSKKTGKPVLVAEVRTSREPSKRLRLRRAYDVSGVTGHKVVVHMGDDVRLMTAREVRALGRGDMTGLPMGGQYRVMDREIYDALVKSPTQPAGKWARFVTRPWKAVATATPTFQLRNLYGDTARLYDAGVPAHSVTRLNAEAVKAIRFMRKYEFAYGRVPDGPLVNLGKSGMVTTKEWVEELRRNGIVQAGVRNSELGQMGGDAMRVYGRRPKNPKMAKFRETMDVIASEAGHPLHHLGRLFRDRETMSYTSLYKFFRERGMSERNAADATMKALYDYGDITDFERMLRNSLFPFYTFTARVVPYYAQTLLQRPGKIAAYELTRQELGKLFGQDADDLQLEAAFRQRLGGFPIAGKWVSMGLPVMQGINELPANPSPRVYGKEVLRYVFGAASPWAKAPAELFPVMFGQPGFNAFFEAPLENPYGRFTPAPVVPGVPWERMPEGTRKRLGVKRIELRSGEIVWAWRGWKSYATNILTPGTPGFALRVGKQRNQRGQSQAQQIASFLLGVKIDNPDPVGTMINNAYARKDLLELTRGDIGQEPGGKNKPEYKRLSKQIRDLEILINGLSTKRGDRKPLGRGPAKGGGSVAGDDASDKVFPSDGGGDKVFPAGSESGKVFD